MHAKRKKNRNEDEKIATDRIQNKQKLQGKRTRAKGKKQRPRASMETAKTEGRKMSIRHKHHDSPLSETIFNDCRNCMGQMNERNEGNLRDKNEVKQEK